MTSRDSNEKAPSRTSDRGPREEGRVIVSSTQRARDVSRVLPDGARFGKYQVVRLIAKGGMSEVYEALHVSLKKGVALKVMSPELAKDASARESFVSEAENAARIRHPNVVDVTDVGVVDELPFLVMALLEGEDLGALYARQGRLPYRSAVDLLLPVAAAVAAAHDMGIVHRDLKPENIFLHREGWRVLPKVLDFGVSFAMDTRRARLTARVVGTPHYMSPEQALGERTTARADQYALGVILYEGLTGTLPRNASNTKELLTPAAYASIPPPSSLVELPQPLEALILRAMAREPGRRFPSMRDLALAMIPFASPAARDYWRAELALTSEEHSEAIVVPPMAHPSASLRQSSSRLSSPVPPPPPPQALHIDAAFTAPPAPFPRAAQIATVYEPTGNPVVDVRRFIRRRPGSFWTTVTAAVLLAASTPWLLNRGRGELGVNAPFPPSASMPSDQAPPQRAGSDQFEIDVQAVPDSATLVLDGTEVGIGRYTARVRKDGALHELRVLAPGYITHSVWFRDQPPPGLIRLSSTNSIASSDSAFPLLPDASRSAHARPTRARKPPARASVDSGSEMFIEPPSPPSNGSVGLEERPKVRIIDEPRPRIQLID